jgi:hypothetical protein
MLKYKTRPHSFLSEHETLLSDEGGVFYFRGDATGA